MAAANDIISSLQTAVHATLGVDDIQRREASEWLEGFQQSEGALETYIDVLHEERGFEMHAFAALSVNKKVVRDVMRLSVEHQDALKDALFRLVQRYDDPRIQNSLVAALAGCLVIGIQRTSILDDLISHWTLDSGRTAVLALKILAEVPQFCKNSFVPLSYVERDDLKGLILGEPLTKQIQEFLVWALSTFSQDTVVHELVMRVFEAWIIPSHVDDSTLAESPLIDHAFLGLSKDGSTFDASVSCLCSLIARSEEDFDIETSALFHRLFSPVLALSVTPWESEMKSNKGLGLCRIFVELGCHHPQRMIFHSEESHRFQNVLLEFARSGDHDECRTALQYWFSLTEYLEMKMMGAPQDVESIRRECKASILSLASLLFDHFARDALAAGLNTTGDDNADFIGEVGKLLNDLTKCFGVTQGLHMLIQESSKRINEGHSPSSVLRAVGAVAPTVPRADVELLPAFFNHLRSLGSFDLRSGNEALSFVGAFAPWLSEHPEHISACVDVIRESIVQDALQDAACLALRSLTRSCAIHMVVDASGVMAFFCETVDALRPTNQLELIKSVGSLIGELDSVSACACMAQVYQPVLRRLHNESVKATVHALCMLQSLVVSSQGNRIRVLQHAAAQTLHPTVEFFREAWPTLASLFATCQQDDSVAEVWCQLVDNSIKGTKQLLAPQLDPVLVVVMEAIRAQPRVHFVALARTTATLFAEMDEWVDAASGILRGLCESIIPFILTGIELRHENCEMAGEYLAIVSWFLTHRPNMITDPSLMLCNLRDLVACCVRLLEAEIHAAFRGAIDVLEQLFELSSPDSIDHSSAVHVDTALIASVLTEHGVAIATRIMRSTVTGNAFHESCSRFIETMREYAMPEAAEFYTEALRDCGVNEMVAAHFLESVFGYSDEAVLVEDALEDLARLPSRT